MWEQVIEFVREGGWLIEGAITLALIFASNIVVRLGLGRLLRRTRGIVGRAALKSLSLPLHVIIWVVGLAFLIDILYEQWNLSRVDIPTAHIRHLTIMVGAFWFIIRTKKSVEQTVREQIKDGKVSIDQTQLEMIGKLVTILTLLITSIVIMQIVGVQVQALVAIGGFGTLAVGLAGKDIFANFFSGFMLYFTRPFKVGDAITSSNKAATGTVERIGWYLTRLRGADQKPVYVPNAVFAGSVVMNSSRRTSRQMVFDFRLRSKDVGAVNKVVSELGTMLREHGAIDQVIAPKVALASLVGGAPQVSIETFSKQVNDLSFLKVKQEILLRCAEVIRKAGAEIT